MRGKPTCASFDKLRMRGDFGGTKKAPHPELVEGRTKLIQASRQSKANHLFMTHTRIDR